MIRNPRGGKVAAQNSAVRETTARSSRSPTRTARGRPTRSASSCATSPTPTVAYVCGRLNLQAEDGRNKEGVYWRYELALRADESRLDSVTGGNGSIYAVRRDDYVEVDPRFGHDLSLPYLMVQRGRRAVYEPEANAFEKATPTNEDEYRRKVRMFEHCWAIVVEGKMLRRLRPLYLARGAVASAPALRERPAASRRCSARTSRSSATGRSTPSRSACSSGCSSLRSSASAIARYYVLVTWATVVALWNYLRRGVPATWDAAEGTR